MASSKVAYVASAEMIKVASLLPSNKKRSFLVHSLVKSLNVLHTSTSNKRNAQVLNPRKATREDLARYHTSDYLDFILDPVQHETQSNNSDEDPRTEFGLEDDCPLFPELPEYVQLIAGATLTAVDALRLNMSDIAINWDGGRHHAYKSRASGFCYVADCILAIMMLKKHPPSQAMNTDELPESLPRVLYLDLDLHFSDAVSSAFSSLVAPGSPRVLTLSIHHTSPGFFPVSPRAQLPNPADPLFDPFNLSIPLLQGASNQTYAEIWSIVEEIKNVYRPNYTIVQCGTDALAGDPCATFNWSLGGEGSLGWCVSRIVNEWEGKKLLLGGGGYNSANAARAWAYLTSIALGNPLDLETDIPDHAGFPLYAPSFTLDVPAGYMHDHNTEEYLASVKGRFDETIPLIRRRMALE